MRSYSGKLPILRATLAIQEKGADQKRGISIQETDFAGMEARVPLLLTPGAAETLAVKIYRLVRTSQCSPLDSLRSCLTVYQNPVPLETLEFQIRLAAVEASDLEFVPMAFRNANISATGRRNPSIRRYLGTHRTRICADIIRCLEEFLESAN